MRERILLAALLTIASVLFIISQTSATDLSVNIKHTELPISETASGKTFNTQRTVNGSTLQGSALYE